MFDIWNSSGFETAGYGFRSEERQRVERAVKVATTILGAPLRPSDILLVDNRVNRDGWGTELLTWDLPPELDALEKYLETQSSDEVAA